ncbi:hypothetical protein ACJX0J_025045, partial [Zea mays]
PLAKILLFYFKASTIADLGKIFRYGAMGFCHNFLLLPYFIHIYRLLKVICVGYWLAHLNKVSVKIIPTPPLFDLRLHYFSFNKNNCFTYTKHNTPIPAAVREEKKKRMISSTRAAQPQPQPTLVKKKKLSEGKGTQRATNKCHIEARINNMGKNGETLEARQRVGHIEDEGKMDDGDGKEPGTNSGMGTHNKAKAIVSQLALAVVAETIKIENESMIQEQKTHE